MTWYIFGYELGWYWKKIYLYLPLHIMLGAIVSLPVYFLLNNPDMWVRIFLFFNSLFLGSCIEWTQNDYSGKEWADRKKWLLGSVRDVVFYCGASWVVFI